MNELRIGTKWNNFQDQCSCLCTVVPVAPVRKCMLQSLAWLDAKYYIFYRMPEELSEEDRQLSAQLHVVKASMKKGLAKKKNMLVAKKKEYVAQNLQPPEKLINLYPLWAVLVWQMSIFPTADSSCATSYIRIIKGRVPS